MDHPTPYLGFADPVSSLTHLLAGGLALLYCVVLFWRRHEKRGRFLSLFVFGLSSVFLLSMSGVFHLLPRGTVERDILQRLDHAAIFVMIAGTFTAVHGVLFQGVKRWGIITLVWVAAVTAITLTTVFFSSIPELLKLSLYLSFGWLGVASFAALWRDYGFHALKPLLYGGIAYTVGAVVEFTGLPVIFQGVFGAHELFHMAVLGGLGFHWHFIARSELGQSAGEEIAEEDLSITAQSSAH